MKLPPSSSPSVPSGGLDGTFAFAETIIRPSADFGHYLTPREAPRPGDGTASYGPEWDADANTPGANGGDNPWAPGYLGPEWEADANTPGANGGDNPWNPAFQDAVWG